MRRHECECQLYVYCRNHGEVQLFVKPIHVVHLVKREVEILMINNLNDDNKMTC